MHNINIKKFYKNWVFWALFAIILVVFNVGEDEKSEAQSDYSNFKSELNAKCKNFHIARQECAAAANYSQCMTIKGGGNPNYADYVNIC